MDYQTIILEKRNRIAYITLNRPDKLNIINEHMADELLDTFNLLDTDKNISVAVITGAGRAFSAGMDTRSELSFLKVKDDKPTFITPSEVNESLQRQHQLIARLRKLKQIAIASVNGICCGGGFGLALACDIRIASEKAELWWVANRAGVIQDYGGTYTLAQLIGTAKALELLCTGDRLDGREAERLGIANKAVPHEQLKQETDAMAEKIAKGAPLSIPLMKHLVYTNLEASLETALINEAITQGLLWSTEDAKRGMSTLLKGSTPEFEGR